MNTHTEAKHTPGPWKIEETQANSAFIDIVSDNGWLVAEIEPNNPEAEANACLIAAAPELLEALAAILRHTDPDDMSSSVRSLAKTAIAKATGGAQ